MREVVAASLAALLTMAALSCADVVEPATGAIRVTAATTGVDLDSDGYRIAVDTGAGHPIQANGSIVVAGLAPGSRIVRLAGVEPNCLAAVTHTPVSVVADDTTDAAFTVECAENVGLLAVVPLITGDDLDNIFQVVIDGGAAVDVGPGGLLLENLRSGSHTVVLTGVADNCSVVKASLEVTVRFKELMVANHTVRCVARVGTLRLATTTTGVDADADGYKVAIDGKAGESVAPNGSLVLPGLREGKRQVSLLGAAGNCAVTGGASREVTISFGMMSQLDFAVDCAPAARMRIRVNATGVDIDPVYRARVAGPAGLDRSTDVPVGAPITVVGEGSGDYSVILEDVAINCTLPTLPANPRAVTANVGSIVDVTFDVACGPSPQIVFVKRSAHGDEIFAGKTTGVTTQLTNNNAEDSEPSFSPDGTRIAFTTNRNGNWEIYVMNADGSGQMRLTNHPATDMNPEWSPDGMRIAFRSDRDGNGNEEIYAMNADGSNVVRLTTNSSFDGKPSWSPDGARIAFVSNRSGRNEIHVMNADGSNVKRISSSTSNDDLPAWSPDGSKIAFTRDVACDDYYYLCHNILVMNPDGSDVIRFETRSHDSEPVWSPDSQWIVFETRYCNYYDCTAFSISAIRRTGAGRTVMVPGDLHNPTWRP
jgi:hypothetical protein